MGTRTRTRPDGDARVSRSVDVPLVLGLRDGLLEGLPLGFHAPLRRLLPLGLPESDRRGVVGQRAQVGDPFPDRPPVDEPAVAGQFLVEPPQEVRLAGRAGRRAGSSPAAVALTPSHIVSIRPDG